MNCRSLIQAGLIKIEDFIRNKLKQADLPEIIKQLNQLFSRRWQQLKLVLSS